MAAEEPELFAARIRGAVTRVLFENRDSGWAVVRFEPEQGGSVSVVGPLAPVFPGESLELEGQWETDSRYGRQFRARSSVPADPQGVAGTLRYLQSGVLPGVGPELARRLVDRFGGDVLRVLDEEPERLLTVRGIGERKLEDIRASWQERSAERQARIFLQGHGLGPALAEKILRAWGDETVGRVRREPYALVREVHGVGFRTADGLALRMGLPADSPARIDAGVRHGLREAADRGHCFLPLGRLIRDTEKILELPEPEKVAERVAVLAGERELVVERDPDQEPHEARAWLTGLHAAETRVARRLAALARARVDVDPQALEGAVRQAEAALGLELAPGQSRAVREALRGRLLVVTGGPGTGKTTLVRVVVEAARMLGRDPALGAPTGRAAKRLEQATGRSGSTLHRLLEYRYEVGFTRGPDNPIDTDLLVVDEVSMVDLPLMDATLGALAPDASLLLVGDADQLPPVGPGATLRDAIESGAVPTVRLTEIYRQAAESLIVRNAHRINRGELPDPPSADDDLGAADFYLIEEGEAERARDLVLRLTTDRIPRRFGLDPRRDIQVLVPMHRGQCGVARLNQTLQAALNPGEREPERPPSEGGVVRVGDRVMQLRNDYDREVFNGDVGRVVAIEGSEVAVDFEGRTIGYDRAALGDLTLAYATTVHKSQGSEYPAVVLVLLPEHRIMLQRNLLYTALTRARRLAVLVSTRETLRRAVENASPARRFTALAERLRLRG